MGALQHHQYVHQTDLEAQEDISMIGQSKFQAYEPDLDHPILGEKAVY